MLLRPIARAFLASWYVNEGLGAVRRPHEHLDIARDSADRVTGFLGRRPLTDHQLALVVRAHGVATVGAGLALATGRAPRLAALALATLTTPLAAATEPFTAGPPSRGARRPLFVQHLGGIGAALIAGADREGRPGLAWRLNRARRTAVEHVPHLPS